MKVPARAARRICFAGVVVLRCVQLFHDSVEFRSDAVGPAILIQEPAMPFALLRGTTDAGETKNVDNPECFPKRTSLKLSKVPRYAKRETAGDRPFLLPAHAIATGHEAPQLIVREVGQIHVYATTHRNRVFARRPPAQSHAGKTASANLSGDSEPDPLLICQREATNNAHP